MGTAMETLAQNDALSSGFDSCLDALSRPGLENFDLWMPRSNLLRKPFPRTALSVATHHRARFSRANEIQQVLPVRVRRDVELPNLAHRRPPTPPQPSHPH